MQVVEDDLVAARQADRSLGSEEFSRLVAESDYFSSSNIFCATLSRLQFYLFILGEDG